jgi:hypothetical protein
MIEVLLAGVRLKLSGFTLSREFLHHSGVPASTSNSLDDALIGRDDPESVTQRGNANDVEYSNG